MATGMGKFNTYIYMFYLCLDQGIVASLREHDLSPDKFTYAALLHCCSAAVDDDLQGQRATQVGKAYKLSRHSQSRVWYCCKHDRHLPHQNSVESKTTRHA